MCAFNVCINLQKVNQMTIGNYRRKIDEYLFLGKAVVATDTETMSVFDQHVFLAKNKDEYLNKIEEALSETCEIKSRQRKEFALSHSWANSVNTMASVIQNFLKSKLK